MIYRTPDLFGLDAEVLALIHEQRARLKHQVNRNPSRWSEFLRRDAFARVLQGANGSEGYETSLAEAIAVVDDERPEAGAADTLRALGGYRAALAYIIQMHDDPHLDVNPQFIKSLHFVMFHREPTGRPGRWRVRREDAGGDQGEGGPDASEIPALMSALAEQVNGQESTDALVLGAMAHLNLLLIQPFSEGNARMARAVQTLTLSRDGVLHPVFCGVEEWLGRNPTACADVLMLLGRGTWRPNEDALPWVRLLLRAHYQQVVTLLRRNREIGRAWEEVARLTSLHGWPDRVGTALMDAAFGFRVRNHRYRSEQKMSAVVASRDLKKLSQLRFLKPFGERRNRFYLASSKLLALRERIREHRRAQDPYEILSSQRTASAGGL